jgi:electron transfer flavoprotein beta subunit
MDIAVLIKYVPDTTAKISISGGRVDESNVSKWSISPFDEYALEAALGMKEANGAKVTAITCGPSRSEKGLRDAAAVGADALVHITVEDLMSLDSTMIQGLLAEAVKQIGADVVFCGKQAADTNSGSTGPGVAELIGAACVTNASEISFDGSGFNVMRPASNGSERVSVSSPCVVAFDKTKSELRRPNVKGIMMAKKKPVESMDSASLGIDVSGSSAQISSQSPPAEKAPGQMFEGSDSVSEVVQKLRNEAKVL